MERMSIKYFVNNNSLGPDRNISSVGFEEIPPNTSYPTLNHSAGYYFNPDKGPAAPRRAASRTSRRSYRGFTTA